MPVHASLFSKIVISLVLFLGGGHSALAKDMPDLLATSYAPFAMRMADGHAGGLDIDVVRRVFSHIGQEITVSIVPWARAMDSMRKGLNPALMTCGKNRSRETFIYFSRPTSQGTKGYFTRQGSNMPVVDNPAGFLGRRIVIVRGYRQQVLLDEAGVRFHAVAESDRAMKMLLNNRVDYFFIDREGVVWSARQKGQEALLAWHKYGSVNYHLCFSKKFPGAKVLRDKFDNALQDLESTGQLNRIRKIYL